MPLRRDFVHRTSLQVSAGTSGASGALLHVIAATQLDEGRRCVGTRHPRFFAIILTFSARQLIRKKQHIFDAPDVLQMRLELPQPLRTRLLQQGDIRDRALIPATGSWTLASTDHCCTQRPGSQRMGRTESRQAQLGQQICGQSVVLMLLMLTLLLMLLSLSLSLLLLFAVAVILGPVHKYARFHNIFLPSRTEEGTASPPPKPHRGGPQRIRNSTAALLVIIGTTTSHAMLV